MEDFIKKIVEFRAREEKLRWEGSFLEYLEIVKKKPYVAQTAHSRIYEMIKEAGIEEEEETRDYPFFSREIFGLERSIEKLVEEYFHAAAKRLDVRKRISFRDF